MSDSKLVTIAQTDFSFHLLRGPHHSSTVLILEAFDEHPSKAARRVVSEMARRHSHHAWALASLKGIPKPVRAQAIAIDAPLTHDFSNQIAHLRRQLLPVSDKVAVIGLLSQIGIYFFVSGDPKLELWQALGYGSTCVVDSVANAIDHARYLWMMTDQSLKLPVWMAAVNSVLTHMDRKLTRDLPTAQLPKWSLHYPVYRKRSEVMSSEIQKVIRQLPPNSQLLVISERRLGGALVDSLKASGFSHVAL